MRFPRASGILLHPTSLPGPHGAGDLGRDAYHFVDWLAAAGQRLWQVLPLTGIGPGNSPYMSSSAFAGNELLIDLHDLHQQGWLDADDLAPAAGFEAGRVQYETVKPFRRQRLAKAAARFAAAGTAPQREDFERHGVAQAAWLGDYALFMALAEAQDGKGWWEWDPSLVRRDPVALAAAHDVLVERVHFWRFCQWTFDRQWASLKRHANQRGVEIIGDAPIFVALQSADVWSHPGLFELGPDGRPSVVAGVPPDYFSTSGQRWGNPLYRWSAHAKDDHAWWVARVRRTFELVDCVRIDHFRGFAAHWEIPADEQTAVNGRWVQGPGETLFKAITRALGPMPIIAEDLGLITPDVEALRRKFGFPGMRVLQFAFEGKPANVYLPHHHEVDTVVYTGTHDNDTTAGWWAAAGEAERSFARGYLATDGHDMPWTLIRTALMSVADTAVLPMQDVLALPTGCRMNFPGKDDGWWRWRFEWSQVHDWHARRLAEMCRLYSR